MMRYLDQGVVLVGQVLPDKGAEDRDHGMRWDSPMHAENTIG